ncbi:MAG TPA: DUF4313 domain-containing protein [Firmicutes bacterium]|nr:DUF4313 domain-containing protein [Bacillota bacterium]
MNQKYLCGVAVNGQEEEILAYFEATPENVAAFLCAYPSYRKIAVCTTDGKPFLTVDLGLRVTIPDQKYLHEKLLPILHPIQQGEAGPPKLKTVSKEIAEAAPCPKPDWNYLYWDGYSNKKYQAILNGKGLLNWEQDGKIHKVELQVRPYMDRNNLAIEIVCWDSGVPEPWKSLTVNLDGQRDKNYAFVDCDLKDDLLLWLDKNGLAKHTGSMVQNGSAVYAEYRFIGKRLKELDPDGYRVYEERYIEARKAQALPEERSQ